MYNHPSSIARRAGDPPRDEVDEVSTRHRDENDKSVKENNRELAEFDKMERGERAADTQYHQGRGDKVYARERGAILDRQAKKRETRERRQLAELKAAASNSKRG